MSVSARIFRATVARSCRGPGSLRTVGGFGIPQRAGLSVAPCRQQQWQQRRGMAGEADKKEVMLTSAAYPNIQRSPKFAQVTDGDIAHFKTLLPHPNSVLHTLPGNPTTTASDLEPFNSDWMRKYRGQTQVVLKPRSTAEISDILAYCNRRSLAIVPQGGNTGLVGGSVPVFDEIVISLAAMNSIRNFDPVSGILVLDAGVILEVADNYLRDRGYIFPLDLGAKGSCHVGGNVATNAGGLRLLRYGSLHGTVLGVEAVLPDGRIVNDLSTLRKNNTGYDMKQLFIGSEGTLGIITAISVQCPLKPAAVNVAYFGAPSFEHVRKAFVMAKQNLGEILSAFELMDGKSQDMIALHNKSKLPLEGKHPFHILIETSGSNKEHDDDKLEVLLIKLMEAGLVSDGILARSESENKQLWTWREGIPEVVGRWGGVYKYDVSIPLEDFYKLVEDTRAHMIDQGLLGDGDMFPVVDVVGYGHMGDSNLHLNVAVRRYDKKVEKALEPWVYAWIQKRKGSISAEHGLGLAKKEYVGYSREPQMLELMREVKRLYDPKGIMNPYKYISE